MESSFPHPKSIINNRKARKDATDEELVTMGADYLQDQASRHTNCKSLSSRTPKACNCLNRFILSDYDYCRSVSKYIVFFAKKPKFEQQVTVIEWLRYAPCEAGSRRFIVPDLRSATEVLELVHRDDGATQASIQVEKVCDYALLTILGYGLRFWRTVQKHAADRTSPSHGLTDQRSNNSISDEAQMNLHLLFAEIQMHASPTPMRFIREKTGSLTERDREEVDMLPTYFTKRSLYKRYAFEQGWNTTTTSTGTPIKKTRREDSEWESREPTDIVSWRSFCRFWLTYYPLLRISKPSEDICNACHKYCNQLKFKRENRDDDSDDDCSKGGDSVEEIVHQSATGAETEADTSPITNHDLIAVPLEVLENESTILAATVHVEAARMQRAYANSKMKEAKESNDRVTPWADAQDCLVADFCQNMDLPHQGMTQPGDTYYFSPLTVNCFGTADAGREFPHMNAYTYHEGEGKKGGNNVSSLLFKDLHQRGWVDNKKGPRNELTVIMDNCGGQNKNKYVLRMLSFLTEAGFYKKVNACFLVAGHTKNICDRMFNLLKLRYRQSDIYSFPQLVEVLNVANNVTCVRVVVDDFMDWDSFQDKTYKKIVTGTVTRTHLFQFNVKRPGIMVTRDTAALISHSAEQDMRKKMKPELRLALLKAYQTHLHTLKAPGIPDIKQWELWKKWRPFVPGPYQDILCPKPSAAVCDKMKKKGQEASKRAQDKQKEKKKRRISQTDTMESANEPNAQVDTVDSTQTNANEKQRQKVSHTKTLDSVTTRLNPSTPS